MRRLFLSLCTGLSVAVTCTLLVGEEPKSSTPAISPGSARYQVASAGQAACLVETQTGNTWVLDKNAGGVLGWFPLPKFGEREPKATERGLPKSPLTREGVGAALRPPLPNWQRDEYIRVKLTKYASGYLGVRATIDGHSVDLLVDTGSPETYLDHKRTAKLGLKWRTYQDPAIALTKPGDKHMVEVCDVPSIQLGSYQTRPLTIRHDDLSEVNDVIPQFGDFTLFDGILGANILNDFLAVIDFEKHDMYLTRRNGK
jgi:gag-polyprotein putative aspartyl protease